MLAILIVVVFGGIISEVFQKVNVTIDGKNVYSGRMICVEIKSAGAATSLDILPICSFPGKHYTSKDIKVTMQ